MIKLNIKDSSFSHDISSVAGKKSSVIEWARDGSGRPDIQFYTHEQCFGPIESGKRNIAWLIESQSIIPKIYKAFPAVAQKFDVVLTHSSSLLKLPNAVFSPGGGVWIGGAQGGGEMRIYDKCKLVSMVSSEKLMCPLHRFRYEIALNLKESQRQQPIHGVDVFGLGTWTPIIDSLADYTFSIVIENYVDKAYFTEKILNCFATGTVPIYCGAEEIGSYFNPAGILQFSSRQELDSVLAMATFEEYRERLPAIRENFERCKEYEMPEDRILRILDLPRKTVTA